MVFSDKHGWLALSGISLVVALALPAFMANLLIHIFVKRKRLNLFLQLLVALLIVVIYYDEFGIMGMPIINDIQNFINNHSGNMVDTTFIDTAQFRNGIDSTSIDTTSAK